MPSSCGLLRRCIPRVSGTGRCSKVTREKEGTRPSGRIAYVLLGLFLENHGKHIQLVSFPFFFVGHEGEHFTSFLLPEQTTFSCESQETSLKERRKTKQTETHKKQGRILEGFATVEDRKGWH